MDLTNIYNDPIITQIRNGDSNSPYVPITETVQIINGVALLKEVPVRLNRVTVTGAGNTWFEVENTSLSSEMYKVDYTNGVVFFHSVNNGKSLNFQYVGKGALFTPATRIWTEQQGNKVVETLQDVIDNTKDAVIGYNEKVEEVDGKIADVSAKIIEAHNKISETEQARQDAVQATTNTIQVTSNYETVVQETKKNYKKMVNTYNDIANIYPNPEIGWVVTAQDTGIEYRWDGFYWVDIGISDVYDGYDVIISQTPPNNVNTLWLDAPVSPYAARVKPSAADKAPTTNQIWWVID